VVFRAAGSQSQFSTVLAAQASDVEGRSSALHAWIIENIASDLGVETLAEKAGMTPGLSPAPASRTGATPASGVEALRVETAQLLWKAGKSAVSWRSPNVPVQRRRTDATGTLRHLGVSPTGTKSLSGG
jgi:transcriptional regulator GlxA family with amidase domain